MRKSSCLPHRVPAFFLSELIGRAIRLAREWRTATGEH